MSEVLALLPTPAVSVPGYRVKRASLLTIKTSLESARQIGAVQVKEVVDKEKIKKLYLEGHNPPDVSEVHFIQVYTQMNSKGGNLARRRPEFEPGIAGAEADQLE